MASIIEASHKYATWKIKIERVNMVNMTQGRESPKVMLVEGGMVEGHKKHGDLVKMSTMLY